MNPDTETLTKIQELAEKRTTAKREMKDAQSEKLQETKAALATLEQAIQESKGCKNGDSPKHIASIQSAHDYRRTIIEETSERVRKTKAEFKELDELFEQTIAESKQGNLFTEAEAQS